MESLYKKWCFVVFLTSLTSFSSKAQNQYIWAEELVGNDVSVLDLDPYPDDGYAYVGYYPSSVKFNSGKTLGYNSKEKHFLASVDSSHRTNWVAQVSGYYGGAHIEDLVIDKDSNHFITGMGQRYVYFHDSSGTKQHTQYLTYNRYRSTAYNNGYLAMFDKHGTPKWSAGLYHEWGGSHFEDATVDDDGHVYALGSFGGSSKGSSCYLTGLSPVLKQVGYADGLVVKYDSTGKLIWHRVLGSEENDNVDFMLSDGKGNLFVQMFFADTATIDTLKIAARGSYLLKLNKKGRVLWAKDPIVGSHPIMGADGNIYSDDIYTLTPTIRGVTLPRSSSYAPYMISFDSLSNLRWIRAFPSWIGSSNRSYFGNIVYSEQTDQIYVSGFVRDTIDFVAGRADPNSLFLLKASAKTGIPSFIDTLVTEVRGSSLFLGGNDRLFGNLELQGTGYGGNGKIDLDGFRFQATSNYSQSRILFEYDMGCSGRNLSVNAPNWVCPGDSALLEAKGPYQVSWYQDSTLLSNSLKTIKVLPGASTSYTAVFSDTASNCTIKKSFPVGHYLLPTLKLDSIVPSCVNGDSIALVARSGTPFGWGGLSGPGVYDSIFRPDSAGVGTHLITYRYVDRHQCTSSVSREAVVRGLPNVSAGPDTSLCQGQSITLYANGATSYQWLPVNASGTSLKVQPSSTTEYQLLGTDSFGCQASDRVQVAVLTYPEVILSNDTAICSGDTAALWAKGATHYLWNNAAATDRIQVYPSASTTFSVVGSNGQCKDTAKVRVRVKAVPQISITGDTVICEKDSTLLVASGTSGQYTWIRGISGSNASIKVSPTATRSYTVLGTDTNGCSDSARLRVRVNPLPLLAIGIGQEICAGEDAVVRADGADRYEWNHGLGTGAQHTVSPTESRYYVVIASTTQGCSVTDSVQVLVNALPTVTLSGDEGPYCKDDDNRYVLNGLPGGGTYAGLGVSGQFFIPIDAGVGSNWVSYSYTDSKGCSNADTLKIVVDDCLNLPEVAAANAQVYPNPSKGPFTLELPELETEELVHLEAWSLNGKALEVTYRSTGNNRFEIDMGSYTGWAVLRVVTPQQVLRLEVNLLK